MLIIGIIMRYPICLHFSNGDADSDVWDEMKDSAKRQLATMFGGVIPNGVYVNSDPRGHMLKLDSGAQFGVPEGMERDWGGNGILAAEID